MGQAPFCQKEGKDNFPDYTILSIIFQSILFHILDFNKTQDVVVTRKKISVIL
jgi:hypothetical protein